MGKAEIWMGNAVWVRLILLLIMLMGAEEVGTESSSPARQAQNNSWNTSSDYLGLFPLCYLLANGRRWFCGQFILYLSIMMHNQYNYLKVYVKSDFKPCRGVQPSGISGPHWKKSCLGPHMKYINTNKK